MPPFGLIEGQAEDFLLGRLIEALEKRLRERRSGVDIEAKCLCAQLFEGHFHLLWRFYLSGRSNPTAVYLDNVAVYTISSSDTVDTQVSAAAGAQTVTVKAWYSDGTFSARSVAVNVQ